MAGELLKPRVSKDKQNTQLSYELSQRIHTAKTYPLQSPNGSTVIIYAQENGVKIVWRGGRRFKDAQTSDRASNSKANGSADVVMLDSDDEAGPEPYVDKPEFEEHEEESHPSKPYPEILQVLDLYFGTDVLEISVLPSAVLKAEGGQWRSLQALKSKIVFAAACADNKVRLIIMPLTPPSPQSKARPEFRSDPTSAYAGKGSWGEAVIQLVGHHSPPQGVAATVELNASSPEPYIIVASHSRDVKGTLLLFRVSLSLSEGFTDAFQSVTLSAPAKCISFNSSLHSERSSHLLLADTTGACRIYDYRRAARGVLDEMTTEESFDRWAWLLSLYPGFQSSKNESQQQAAGFGRKTILDAKWVSDGRAVVALLGDGQWLIWDLEGAGRSGTTGLLGKQSLQGGSISEYAISGYIDGANKPQAVRAPQITSSKFAPMTPGTRKSTEPLGKLSAGPVRGQISVFEKATPSATTPPEESVAFWFGDSYTLIQNLNDYWNANARKSANGVNLFNGSVGGRMIKLENIDLQGERCSGIDQILNTPRSPTLSTDIVVLGEHRFLVLQMAAKAHSPAFQTNLRKTLGAKDSNVNVGELDVVGIDQALDRMTGSTNGFLRKRIQ